jgi:hypothetical protein
MTAIIQFTKREDLKALPILLRHTPAVILRDRTYVLSERTVTALHQAGVKYKLIAHDNYSLCPPTGRILE